MIKRNLLAFAIFISVWAVTNGQAEFTFDQNGLSPKYIVHEIDSLSKTELFNYTSNWIKETYRDPDEVIKATIENEKIRFEGFKDNLFSYRSLSQFLVDAYYTIEISFKDGRYKFEPVEIRSKFQSVQCYQPGPYFPIDLSDGSQYYKHNGKLLCSNTLPESVSELLNTLDENLNSYLTESINGEDDW